MPTVELSNIECVLQIANVKNKDILTRKAISELNFSIIIQNSLHTELIICDRFLNINMKWYEGDIAEAVALSKIKNAMFVVFVEGMYILSLFSYYKFNIILYVGNDKQSEDLSSLINHNNVSSKLKSDIFVSIKIDAQSVAYSQFAVICIL